MTQEETRFVRLQKAVGKLFTDHGNEVYLGLTKLDHVDTGDAKEIGSLIQEIGDMLAHKHNDNEFELKEEYLKAEFMDDPLHRSMLGFHSYHLCEVVKYLLEGKSPKDAIEYVKINIKAGKTPA